VRTTYLAVVARVFAPLAALAALAACSDDPTQLTGGPGGSARSSSTAAANDGDGIPSAAPSAAAAVPAPTTTASAAPTASGAPTTPAPTSSAPPATPPPAASGAEQTCVDAINKYRATLSLPPLARWTSAETCADGQAKSDGSTNTAHGAFTKCGEYAQNECPGWPGAPQAMIGGCLQMMWNEGPGGGHYENMAGKGWTQVSCGFATAANGSVWAVQDFR
jgi:uncharacterized protein YkwD